MSTKITKEITIELTNATLLQLHREGKFKNYLELLKRLETEPYEAIFEAIKILARKGKEELSDEEIFELILEKGYLELQTLVSEELGKPIFGRKKSKEMIAQTVSKTQKETV